VIARRTLPPPAASVVYELTEFGRAVEAPLLALGRWGAMSMGEREARQVLRSEWLAVALKAFFRPEAAADLRATVALRFDDGAFLARIDRGSLLVEPEDRRNGADLVLTTEVETLIAFLAGADVPTPALAPEGDPTLLERLPEIFAFGVG
jgi:hypothetical protein